MKESVLMLASFEKTTEFLFDAAVHARASVAYASVPHAAYQSHT